MLQVRVVQYRLVIEQKADDVSGRGEAIFVHEIMTMFKIGRNCEV